MELRIAHIQCLALTPLPLFLARQLQFKLNLVQHDVRFFLTVLHNRKSEFLESCLVGEFSGM